MAKKRYRVIGDSVVAGHSKGEEFEYEYEPENEAWLVAGGYIEPVKKEKEKEA